jgi:hypothetical protein
MVASLEKFSIALSPDLLPPSPSTSSAITTPDPSASLLKTEHTPPPPPNKRGGGEERELDATEPAADGCIQMEYSSDKLFYPNIETEHKITCKNLVKHRHCMIIENISETGNCLVPWVED